MKQLLQADKCERRSRDRADKSDKVLEGMHGGLSCFKACQIAGVPHSTFIGWLNVDTELADRYTRARENLIERMANELLEISDADPEITGDGKKDWAAIQKHKLQVDTRKWLLSKLAPKKYGDRIEVAGDKDAPLKVEHAIDVSKLSTDALAQIVAARKSNDAE
jgi:hypothetical protein